jgi:hypothetical protein
MIRKAANEFAARKQNLPAQIQTVIASGENSVRAGGLRFIGVSLFAAYWHVPTSNPTWIFKTHILRMKGLIHPHRLLLLLALLPLAGCRDDSIPADGMVDSGYVFHQTSKTRQYIIGPSGYRFAPPDGWRAGDARRAEISIEKVGNREPDDVISVTRRRIPKDRKLRGRKWLEAEAVRVITMSSLNQGEEHEKEHGFLDLDGETAAFAIHSIESAWSSKHIVHVVVVEHNNKAYYITGVFPGENWIEHLPVFREVLNRWKWLKPGEE